MTRALFTKTVTNVYQYEVEVEDISMFEGRESDLLDTFPPETLVSTNWYVDVEEVDD